LEEEVSVLADAAEDGGNGEDPGGGDIEDEEFLAVPFPI